MRTITLSTLLLLGLPVAIGWIGISVAGADDSPSASEVMHHLLSGAELRQRLVGNTITGEYDDGDTWAAYYAPDGWVHGFDAKTGLSMGKYAFQGDLVCYDYGRKDYNYCTQISLIGDQVNFVRKGRVENDGNRNQKLVSGNSEDL
jgi:hypothetical protein